MGYYVEITESTWQIKAEHLDAAYQAMCALNARDDLKRGWLCGPGEKTEKYFSWMDADYPSTCKDTRAILEALGFDVKDVERVDEAHGEKLGDKIAKLRAKAHGTKNEHEAFAYLQKANELEALPPSELPTVTDLRITWYNNKTGQEDLFLQAIAPFSTGYINWLGEDGNRWRNEVRNGAMSVLAAKISY